MFAVVGCADLTTVGDEGAPHWMQRNGDLAVFGCNGSSSTWKLKCDGNQWVGERGFCHDVLSIGSLPLLCFNYLRCCIVRCIMDLFIPKMSIVLEL